MSYGMHDYLYEKALQDYGIRKAANDHAPGSAVRALSDTVGRIVGINPLAGAAAGLMAGEFGKYLPPRQQAPQNPSIPVPPIKQRPGIPAPADDPAPANQRPAGYGITPKPVSHEWSQKTKDYQDGLAGPVNAPTEFRRHLYQQNQRLINSPLVQGYIGRMRNQSK